MWNAISLARKGPELKHYLPDSLICTQLWPWNGIYIYTHFEIPIQLQKNYQTWVQTEQQVTDHAAGHDVRHRRVHLTCSTLWAEVTTNPFTWTRSPPQPAAARGGNIDLFVQGLESQSLRIELEDFFFLFFPSAFAENDFCFPLMVN